VADARPFAVEPVGAVRAVGVAGRHLLFEKNAEVFFSYFNKPSLFFTQTFRREDTRLKSFLKV
jgi:hypothetical protein